MAEPTDRSMEEVRGWLNSLLFELSSTTEMWGTGYMQVDGGRIAADIQALLASEERMRGVLARIADDAEKWPRPETVEHHVVQSHSHYSGETFETKVPYTRRTAMVELRAVGKLARSALEGEG